MSQINKLINNNNSSMVEANDLSFVDGDLFLCEMFYESVTD